MDYELDFSGSDSVIREQAIRFNNPIPERILKRPYLDDRTEFYFSCFVALGRDRQVGFSASYIPTMSIVNYAKFLGIDEDNEIFEFLYIITGLDGHYIQRANSK